MERRDQIAFIIETVNEFSRLTRRDREKFEETIKSGENSEIKVAAIVSVWKKKSLLSPYEIEFLESSYIGLYGRSLRDFENIGASLAPKKEKRTKFFDGVVKDPELGVSKGEIKRVWNWDTTLNRFLTTATTIGMFWIMVNVVSITSGTISTARDGVRHSKEIIADAYNTSAEGINKTLERIKLYMSSDKDDIVEKKYSGVKIFFTNGELSQEENDMLKHVIMYTKTIKGKENILWFPGEVGIDGNTYFKIKSGKLIEKTKFFRLLDVEEKNTLIILNPEVEKETEHKYILFGKKEVLRLKSEYFNGKIEDNVFEAE